MRKAVLTSLSCAPLLLSLLLLPCEARADAIRIDGGSYGASAPSPFDMRFRSFGFNFQTSDFSTSGGAADGPNQGVSSTCVFPCQAGSTFTVRTGSGLSGFSPSVLQLNGQSAVLGIYFDTRVLFQTGEVTIPLNAGPELTLTTTFTMSGVLNFTSIGVFPPVNLNTEVFGSGTASISFFFSNFTHGYEINRVSYNFTPVPEPATMILLGTGLAGLAARRRRRSKRPAA